MNTAPIGDTPGSSAASTTRAPSKSLRQEDFLKLLIAQTRQQNPFDTRGITDIMDQMLALGNFQAMQTVADRANTSAALAASQFARLLLGSRVEVADGAGGIASGTVTAARLDGSSVFVEVGGKEYAASSILHFKSDQPDRP